MKDFVHLHLHSEYSLLDGACRIAQIPKYAAELGQSAVALTDHGVMYGVVDFYEACKKEGIKPIIGCEVYVAQKSRFDKSGSGESEANHLVLLVKNEIGYKNLIYMVSRAFTEGFYRKPRVDLELLKEHSEGLIALSACLAGYIPRQIMSGNIDAAEEYAITLNKIFGDGNFYLEIQNHGLDGQAMVNECIAGISEHTGIPLVATNDVHYLKKSDAEIQSVMMCIQTNSMLADGRPIGFETDEFYMKSGEEMDELFGRFDDAIENTVKIAEMCNFDFTFGKTLLPEFLPPDGLSQKQYLEKLASEGLAAKENSGEISYDGRYTRDDYKYRISYELMVISSMGYSGYYLIVADFVNYAKSKGITVGPGRGSGAGSLIAYLIGITEVDPVKYNLLFESFLNSQRISMPDFDIDFCYRRRDEVINYVAEKYGKDQVAQIVTFGTLAAKAALRDVGRVMGMSYAETDSVVRALPEAKYGITLNEALQDKKFREIYDSDNKYRDLIDIARSLEGMPRNSSTHAAGVVITDKPVFDYVPLSANGDTVVTQFDMDTVAKLGLLKFDFLALRYLTIIADTESEIRKIYPDFDIREIPFDDRETYELISSGNTDGLFQLESEGMQQLLISMRPESITDIMTAIALYRPGPMDSIPKFLSNRADKSRIKYKFNALSDILDETCGCIVYQEQIMQIFREIAGYTYGKADIVRRAIAKKKPGVIEKEREGFIKGAVSKGYFADDADELYGEMTDFANYGFKKSHAAAYAFISYRTAYLKAHFAPMYYSSLITSVFGNTAKMNWYINESCKHGIKTLPPDINESENAFSVKDGAIRFGLSAIKNVGDQFIVKVINEREKGRFTSFFDFISRMDGNDLNKRQIESLIKSGAFDSLGTYRSQLLSAYGDIIDSVHSTKKGNLSGQLDMFTAQQVNIRYPDIPEFPLRKRLFLEKESAGMYLSGHILDDYGNHISDISPVQISKINEAFSEGTVSSSSEKPLFREKQTIKAAGVITSLTKKNTKNGDTMVFATLEDRLSEIELIIFPTVYREYSSLITKESLLLVNAELSIKDELPKLIVRSVSSLIPDSDYQSNAKPENSEPQAQEAKINSPSSYRRLFIKVPSLSSDQLKRTMALCDIFSGSSAVVIYDSENKRYVKSDRNADVTPFLIDELREIVGVESVIYK